MYEEISHGDDVTIIAFGWGRTTVHALRACSGTITAYEASN